MVLNIKNFNFQKVDNNVTNIIKKSFLIEKLFLNTCFPTLYITSIKHSKK